MILFAAMLVLAVAAGALLPASVERPGIGAPSTAAAGSGPRYSFANVTREAGMTDSSRSWGSSWADYDSDGRPDLWIGRHWKPPWLMRGLGGTSFGRVMDDDLRMDGVDRHACAWGEANRDGRPDLYCVRGADMGTGAGANQLFIQTDSGLRNRGRLFGVRNSRGRGRTANWLDYDSDGDLDLFVGNLTRTRYPNVLFRNDGDSFTKVRAGLGEELVTVSSSWADWDRDGDPDLLVLQHGKNPAIAYENVNGRFRKTRLPNVTGRSWLSGTWGDFNGDGRPDLHLVSYRTSRVLRNTPSGFKVVNRTRLRAGRTSVWFDADNDSDLDLYVVQGARGRHESAEEINKPNFLLLNKGGRFEKLRRRSFRGPRRGNADGVSAADFDRDGRVDFFITNGLYYWRGPNALLRNTSTKRNWVGVDLRGSKRNPFGYGAIVRARVGDRVVRRQVTDEVNFRTQNEAGYVHLGIRRENAVRVRVQWPDGTRDCRRAVNGSVVEVRRGRSPCSRMQG